MKKISLPRCREEMHKMRQRRTLRKNVATAQSSVEDCEIFNHKPSSKSAYVTVLLNNEAEVQLQIDTGASCNVLPQSDYIRATGDSQCKNLERSYNSSKAKTKHFSPFWRIISTQARDFFEMNSWKQPQRCNFQHRLSSSVYRNALQCRK